MWEASFRGHTAYLRDASRLSLSTLPHTKILAALKDGSPDSGASVFEQQWKKGVAELVTWTEKQAVPAK